MPSPPATQPSDRPPIYALSNEFLERWFALAPKDATMAGVPGHDHEWDDFGPAGHAAREALCRDFRGRIEALPATSDPWARLAAGVLADQLDERLAYYQNQDHLRDLNNIESTFQTLRQVFDVMDTGTAAGWENIAARLAGLGGAIASYRESLDEGRRTGNVVARRQVRAVIKQARVHAGSASFYPRLLEAFDQARIADSALRARIEAGVAGAKENVGKLADWLEQSYLPAAAEKDAVGRERYLRAARRHLGMTLDPEETYAWGWSEFRRIEAAMSSVAREIKPGATVPEVTALLASDPARAAHSHEEFTRLMLERQQQALRQLDGSHFDVPDPIRRIEVKIAPPGGALGAYYMPPSEDFSRPGTVWYSPGDKKSLPLWGEVTTAYHEGFPGHHLQCSIQVWLAERLSRFQRLQAFYPGYAEGWALYAEQLMFELGYFEKPEYVLGMHAAQLMRASRVVADIGMHLELAIPRDIDFHPGETWSGELGIELMNKRAFLAPDFAESEVTRYLGWPGQAISYKVGQRVILDLRDALRAREGSRFDLKQFHNRVLNVGAVGLDRLRQEVLGAA